MKRKFIFSINTGRSGSEYLQKLFSQAESCCCFHEPSPICNGAAMRKFNHEDASPMRRLVEAKVAKIQPLLINNATYVETNHCFIKGFGWIITEFIPQEELGVVVLRRERAKIVNSLWRTDSSPLVPTGRDWILTPTITNYRVEPPGRILGRRAMYHLMRALRLPSRGAAYYASVGLRKPNTLRWVEQYERDCLEWYVREVEARCAEFKHSFPNVAYYDVDLEQLNDVEVVRDMFRFFSCVELPSLAEVVGNRVNLKETLSRQTTFELRR